ncbi:MAG: hypothetical protein IH889_04955 [Planctomycetes bacterium]|nr:hypothetical protein [Planctomycetota bacterium]
MSNGPLAYHITFGTYGTRLHGDPRGTVDRTLNNRATRSSVPTGAGSGSSDRD